MGVCVDDVGVDVGMEVGVDRCGSVSGKLVLGVSVGVVGAVGWLQLLGKRGVCLEHCL